MDFLRSVRTFGVQIMPTRSRTAAFVWLAIWFAVLRYGDLSGSLIAYLVPLGFVLFALGPLEFLPDHWHRLNFLANGVTSGFFFASIMFTGPVLSYEVPMESDARTAFCLSFWVLQLVIFHKADAWIKQSPFRRLGEYRMAYSPPGVSRRAERD